MRHRKAHLVLSYLLPVILGVLAGIGILFSLIIGV
jgi:hypothetical protein